AHPCKTSSCDHLCIPAWSHTGVAVKKCICATGYILFEDRCIIKTPDMFLLYSDRFTRSIRGKDLASGRDVMVPLMLDEELRIFDVDVQTKSIIYYNRNHVISQVPIESTGSAKELIQLVFCDLPIVDWTTRNLYFHSFGSGYINVLDLANSTNIKALFKTSINEIETLIALDPTRGLIFFTNPNPVLSRSSIYRAYMDGTGYKTFLKEKVFNPSGLEVDIKGGRLYWLEYKLAILQSVNLDGNDLRIEIGKGLNNPYQLTIGPDGTLYFINVGNATVMSYKRGEGSKVAYKATPAIGHIKIYDANKIGNRPKQCDDCTGLCLRTVGGAVTCACRDGFQLAENMKDCVTDQNYIAPSACPKDSFQCHNDTQCIPNTYVCDGATNCADGSDESAEMGGPCGNITCGEHYMKCDNTTCLPRYWICDGERDCRDGSDEDPSGCAIDCPANEFNVSTQFKCKESKRCIPKAWVCDHVPDCSDESDEFNCNPSACDNVTDFTCKNGECIASHFYCDSIKDCQDGSDEIDCIQCNPETQIECYPRTECLPSGLRCDGKIDCPDGTDEQDCGRKHCESNEFTCSNFECIPKMFVCDSDLDCLDGSDEVKCDASKMHNNTDGQQKMNCMAPRKLCDNDTKCISPAQMCDNRQDCADGSDEPRRCSAIAASRSEANGGKSLLSSCEYPNRLCDNGTKCITMQQLCDATADCLDESDEGMRCSEDLCAHSFICSHECHNAPDGVVCSCPPYLHLQADRTHCLETHPCEAWGVCSQKCIPRGSRYKCTCVDGYVLQDDGFTCKSSEMGRPFVTFSNRHELRGVDLHTFSQKSFISSLKNTITLDFYHSNGTDMLFWTDVIDDKIFRGTIVGGSLGNIEVVVNAGLSTAEGLAVDWIGQNLYWVESNLDQIEVAKLNGSFRRTLVAGEMESPRAIAVDPRDGYLFWSDWDNSAPRIERCSLAGLDRQIVVQVDHFIKGGWPNGLTLDYVMRRIYWADARSDSIHTCDYNGNDHHEVISNQEFLSHPFAISLFENYVYWTDWRTNSVMRANKWTGGDVMVIQRTLTQPFDIKIMHPSRQPPGKNPCGSDNGGCSHLCLIHLNGTYRCDCPHISRSVDENFLLISNFDEYFLLHLAH
uniref:EGF-like domain-containing protein n=1 Tax=Dendroctonus ponderosae TaxID=77166 RepID=A0AAR5Q063_DENPD